jgi:predicted RNA-binding protein with TRAM domain
MDVGDVIDLDLTGVAHGGVFVARVPADDGRGRVVFVPDTLPGESRSGGPRRLRC